MKSLMKLTSLLLIETSSDSDYIMVNIANTNCTDGVVPASSSQRKSIEVCIDNQFDITSDTGCSINSSIVCQRINR